MVHIDNGVLLSHKKNKFESVLVRWMNLEPVIQSGVSQKEKNKYCLLICISMESRKMVLMKLFAGQQWRCRHREQTVDTVVVGESGMNGESSIDMCILSCVKQIASEKLSCYTGSPTRTSVMTYRGGVGRRREAQEGVDVYMTDVYCHMAETNTTL